MSAERSPTIAEVFRDAHGQAVATLVRVFGDITLAEDAVQDAFTIASERWTEDGLPPNPAGWIVTTAKRRAIDVMRRENRGRQLETYAAQGSPTSFDADPVDEHEVRDDQLRLIFTCCHPALRTEHQVALTLRLIAGLSVEEIARSFLVGEDAMKKRIGRAKYKISAANIPYRIPEGADLPHRLHAALSVIYLIFNTGLDDPERSDLREEALRLARAMHGLMPEEPEAAGLLALLLFNEARMPARIVDDEIVLLRDQDRTQWDDASIEEATALIRACVRRNRPGPFQLQASIQAIHCNAPTFEQTDWTQILATYHLLHEAAPTPVVAMNRAIALGEVAGPLMALAELDELSESLDAYYPFHAARATMLLGLDRHTSAADAFDSAAELAPTPRLRRHLRSRAIESRRQSEI